MFSFMARKPNKEAAMTTIQVFEEAAGQARRVLRGESQEPGMMPSDKPMAQDRDMMYAWSIGVTQAAHDAEQGALDREECPPEVYIG
jgi:hypothetical protein